MRKGPQKQVHPAASAVLILLVLGGVQAVWWRFLVYRERGVGPGGASGPMSMQPPGVRLPGRTDVFVRSQSGGEDPGYADGPGHAARFDRPTGLALDPAGNLYVADTGNNRIRVVSPDGDTTTLAGGDQGYADGPAAQARFNAPCGVAVGPDGSVYVADTGNRCIRRIARGTVITVAGKPGAGDATGAAADLFSSVAYVAAPAPHLVVADAAARRLQEFSLEGKVGSATSVAGPPTAVVSNPLAAAVPAAGTLMLGGKALRNVAFAATYEVSDERARSVMVRHPVGLCPLGAGWLVTDSGQGAVILVANGRAEVVAGTCLSDTPSWGFRDGDGAKAMFRTMSGIVSDGKRYAYVADTGNNAIRRLDVSNVVAH